MTKSKRIDFRSESGFTLMELIVVIGVIAILIAILLPQFNGYTDKANAVSAKSNAKTALTAASTYKTEIDIKGDSWKAADAVNAVYKAMGGAKKDANYEAPKGVKATMGTTTGTLGSIETEKGELTFTTELNMATGQLGKTTCKGDKTRCDALQKAGSIDESIDK